MMTKGDLSTMVTVICEDCHEEQRTNVYETPTCDNCGSHSLTGTVGYDSVKTEVRSA